MNTLRPVPADLIPPPLPQERLDEIEAAVTNAQHQALREGRTFDAAAVRADWLRGAARFHAWQHASGFAARMGPPAPRA